jgi:hypothetical protein
MKCLTFPARLVQHTIEGLMYGRTTVVVAHRLSTVAYADKIVVLQKGKVVECGEHDELMAEESGKYKKMVNRYNTIAAARVVDKTVKKITFVAEVVNDVDGSSGTSASDKASPQTDDGNPRPVGTIAEDDEIIGQNAEAAPDGNSLNDDYTTCDGDEAIEKTDRTSGPKPADEAETINAKSFLWKLSVSEALSLVFGCFGSAVYGTILPLFGFLLGSIVADLYIPDPELLIRKAKFWCLIIMIVGMYTCTHHELSNW